MITIQAGKEFQLTATFTDKYGQPTDPTSHEIIIAQPDGQPFLKVTTPEHLQLGVFRLAISFPANATEGNWKIRWTAVIDGIPTTEVTDISITQQPVQEPRVLQIHMTPKNFFVTFLGTRGEIEKTSFRHQNTSSIIIYHKPHKILVDFGKDHTTLPEDITEVIVTHAHPDHAFGLKGKHLTIPVYMNKFSNRLLSKENYPFNRKVFWRNPFHIGNIKITPLPVKHSVRAPASGLILEAAGRKIAYFPDVLEMRNLDVLRGIDVYIGDGASLDRDLVRVKEGKRVGHASIRTQLGWLQQAKVPRAIFTHFGRWAVGGRKALTPIFEQLSTEFDVKVKEAFDGYRIHIGRTIQLQRTLPGIYLPPPHAANIVEGYQTIIVTPKPAPISFLSMTTYFVQDDKVYGRLRLTTQHGPVSLEDLLKLSDKHQMAPEEFRKYFPGITAFYYYEFKLIDAFIPPKAAKNIRVWKAQASAEQIQQEAEKQSPFAPVSRYGHQLGKMVTLKEVLSYYEKPIVLKKGYITLMGGLTNWGKTEGDVDFLQAEAKEVVSRDQPVLFRLGRALPSELAERLSRRFIGEYGGAFTSHVPLYDLVLIPSTERRLIRMQRIEALRDPEGRKQAALSLKEDKVEPLRFVAPLKGYRAYYKFPELAADDIAREFGKEDFPAAAQKKYDGAITEWMKDDAKIIVRTDSGFDVTDRFPSLVGVAKRILPSQATILCETEMWSGEEHLPREVVSGYLNSKGKADDSNLVLNVFDIMLDGEDIHKLGYEERYKHLKKIHWGQSTDEIPKAGFNLTPTLWVYSPNELLSALKKTAAYPASEGTVIKSARMTYELDGLTRKMLKWKKMAEIHGIITFKHETKTPGVFTYYISVGIPAGWNVPKGVTQVLDWADGKSFMFIAKTFNVAEDYKVGTVVSFSFHTLNWYKKADGTQYITAYEPKLIGKSTHERPDSAEEVVAVAREKELLVTKRLQTFPMDDKEHPAVMQMHYRGRSAHMDFRIKVDDHLNGLTMLIEKPNAILDDVTSIEQAKQIERRWEHYFKLRNVPQTEITDPRRKTQVGWKASEPLGWLSVEKKIEPGEVGATRTEWGVYSIVDKPTVFFGAQKSYFKEFFIEGKIISGRWVVRLLRNPWAQKPPFIFMMWKPEDQTPYVLTKRAVEKKWIPPVGVSALPPTVRESVPAMFKYWVKNNITERLAIREALVEAIAKGEVHLKNVELQSLPDIKQPVEVSALLQHRWWRGQLVVRGGPTEELWDLHLKTNPLVHFVLRSNPQTEQEVDAILEKAEWKEISGIQDLKPGNSLNPTPDTPAYVEQIDQGKAKIWESKTDFIKVTFEMGKLKGMFVFTKLDPHQNLWTMKREEEIP